MQLGTAGRFYIADLDPLRSGNLPLHAIPLYRVHHAYKMWSLVQTVLFGSPGPPFYIPRIPGRGKGDLHALSNNMEYAQV